MGTLCHITYWVGYLGNNIFGAPCLLPQNEVQFMELIVICTIVANLSRPLYSPQVPPALGLETLGFAQTSPDHYALVAGLLYFKFHNSACLNDYKELRSWTVHIIISHLTFQPSWNSYHWRAAHLLGICLCCTFHLEASSSSLHPRHQIRLASLQRPCCNAPHPREPALLSPKAHALCFEFLLSRPGNYLDPHHEDEPLSPCCAWPFVPCVSFQFL